ncbi:HNH endonuclease, partial [Cryobacterium adonitolivorans]
AILEGYGPIDPETARRIAGTATSWTRILTHPETGCRLSMGRITHDPPADMRRYLQARDQTCQRIGCTRRASLSEIDHTRAWNTGGPTDVDNLVHLCKSCHRLKHQSSFTTSQGPGGALTWTTPSGKTYTSAPTSNDPTSYDNRPTNPIDPAASPVPPAQRPAPAPSPVRPSASAPRHGVDDPPPF